MPNMTMNDITAPSSVEIRIDSRAKTIWINVNGQCVLRCCRIGELSIVDHSNTFKFAEAEEGVGKDYYFCYHDGTDHCQGFHITPISYFDEHEACADYHLTSELEKVVGGLDPRFTEIEEGVFEFSGEINEGKSWLLDHGFVEKPDLLP